MKKKLLAFSLAAFALGSASAQSLRAGYIEWPSSQTLPSYVDQFISGNLNLEDENFFISRVKPKVRFRNTATQVNTSLTAENSKRVCLWLPVTSAYDGQFNLNAIPNSVFDSEVFSNWSYIDVFGDWTSPHGWVPGSFADIAHKNGVSVSGVASIPYGAISENALWQSALVDQAALKSEDLGKFLWYHGVDGLGYNSEFSGLGSSNMKLITQQHEDIITYLTEKGNPVAENIWYDGTNINGSISFDTGLTANNFPMYMNDNGSRRASLFTNYNWPSKLSTIYNYATQKGVSSLYIYAGMNMQGGEPSSSNGETYPVLAQYPISMGYWGAHQYNMFWLNRTARGSSPEAAQATYLYDTERFFTNGAQNPAVSLDVYTQRNHYPTDAFFGISKFRSAASTLCWSLDDEPFITYFNIGNGQFFNWMGERVSSNEWYNIGIQDYLPNWRWWWAPSLLGRDVEASGVGMSSTETWADAYLGGSCMEITGSATEAYLHLFKTQFELKTGDIITVRYKLVSGKADKVTLVATVEGAEDTAIRENNLTILDSTTDSDETEWQTATFSLTGATGAQFNGKTLALLALHFQGAESLNMRLGELSITRGSTATPASPIVSKTKLLGSHYQGVDGKIIFSMESSITDAPVYNSDVNVSMFKIYSREEGGEAKFVGATTSWAALAYNCPIADVTDLNKKVQLGVSAVSLDMQSESEISWGELLDKPDYSVTDDFEIDKAFLKPGENFTIGYVDPLRKASTWSLYNVAGKQVYTTTATSFTTSLSDVGGYDLKIDEGTDAERVFNYYVQVSSEDVGALPEIYTMSIDGKQVTSDDDAVQMTIVENINKTNPVTVSYTGRKADGIASRGIDFNQQFIGCRMSDLGIGARQSFSVAFWVKYTNFNDKTWALLDITNRGGSWPVSNWGWCWLRGNSDGTVQPYTFRGNASDGVYPGEFKYVFPNSKFQIDSWAHVAITFEYNPSNTNQFRSLLYINGVLQESTWSRGTGGSGTGTTLDYGAKNYSVQSTDWLSTGGLVYSGSAVDGVLDDFQVWSKAMTQEDVDKSFKGLDAQNLPDDVLCYWDFESDADPQTFGFASVGAKSGVELYNFNCVGTDKEGQGVQTPIAATTNAGCPFLTGSAYPVETLPTWSSRKCEITEAQGKDTEGSAKVAFTKPGDYVLTLTLKNSYGEATADYPVFAVGESGVHDVIAPADYTTYADGDAIFVQFNQDGKYVLTVYDMQGRVVTAKAAEMRAGELMHVKANNGAYIIKVRKDGRELRAIKLMKK